MSAPGISQWKKIKVFNYSRNNNLGGRLLHTFSLFFPPKKNVSTQSCQERNCVEWSYFKTLLNKHYSIVQFAGADEHKTFSSAFDYSLFFSFPTERFFDLPARERGTNASPPPCFLCEETFYVKRSKQRAVEGGKRFIPI